MTFSTLPRSEKMRLLFREKMLREIGEWGEWESNSFPKGTVSNDRSSFSFNFIRSYHNNVFSVLERPMRSGTHLAVSSLSGERPSWWEMQRIKNELMGAHTTGIEVYPPQNEVVDGADMFHIFVTTGPASFSLINGEEE